MSHTTAIPTPILMKQLTNNQKSLRYVILESEYITRLYLIETICRLRPSYILVSQSDSVADIDRIIRLHPDFIISDVLLSDGLSLSEFRRLQYICPIIIYARDNIYHMIAKMLNVVYFGLKPVSEQEVELSLHKVENALGMQGNGASPVTGNTFSLTEFTLSQEKSFFT